MNLRKIARRICGFSAMSLEQITDKMRKDMGVSKRNPYESGANSVVFDNDAKNIVVFSEYDKVYDVAKKAKERSSQALPEIFDVQKFPLEDEEPGTFSMQSYMYAVEMQKLKMLDKNELNTFDKYKDQVFKEQETPKSVEPKEQKLVDAMTHLMQVSEKENVHQTDLYSENVAWDGDDLKYIDLETIKI